MKVNIAAGFDEDAKHLLNDFLALNSFEFTLFASIWKKHKFSLIFMGRSEDIELTEFTNEIFKKTSQILSSLSPLPYQAGVIFMLYAIYQNQLSVPPIKIRIKMDHWIVIDTIRNEAIVKRYKSLHYVIDYLIKYALTPVAHQTLKGPIIGTVQKLSKSSEVVENMKANYKADLVEYDCSSSLSKLDELQNKYLELKKNFDSVDRGKSENAEVYKEVKENLKLLLNSKQSRRRRSGRNTGGNIGNRRSEIKAAAFSKKPKDFWGRNTESNGDPDSDDNQVPSVRPAASRSRRGKRAPHHERRVGRPRKTPIKRENLMEEEEDYFDITHLLEQQKDFHLPPETFDKGKKRTLRLPYYQLSPKHDDDDDDDIHTGI